MSKRIGLFRIAAIVRALGGLTGLAMGAWGMLLIFESDPDGLGVAVAGLGVYAFLWSVAWIIEGFAEED